MLRHYHVKLVTTFLQFTDGATTMNQTDFETTLVNRLNAELDLPFLSEDMEGHILRGCVASVARFLPDSLKNFILDASDGLDETEVARHSDVLVAYLNSRIDIPGVPEYLEDYAIRAIVDGVMRMATQGQSIHQAA